MSTLEEMERRITSEVFLNSHPKISNNTSNSNLATDHQNYEISTNEALKNISNILLDENISEDINVYPDNVALQAIERSYYDIIGQRYPHLPQSNNWPKPYASLSDHNPNESLPIVEFKKGFEEGMKFLPSFGSNKLAVNLEDQEDCDSVGRKLQKDERRDNEDHTWLKCKKHVNSDDLSLAEGRKWKIPVLYFKYRDDELEKVFLLREEHYAKEALYLRKIMMSGTKPKGKTKIHESLVDLGTLLIHCSQAIAINDTQNAHQLIKCIRTYSFPDGDGVQRMAHIFVNALEARLNGTTDKPCRQLLVPQESLTDYLDVFRICIISNPVLMASHYFVNHTILNALGKTSKLHIINLGTEFRFPWPCLIHALSVRMAGPPKLRITNIEAHISRFPSGERIEAARQKLVDFARTIGVPLEYRGIYTKWDEIRLDDLNIEMDEVLIVSALHGLEYLGNEAGLTYSPRNRVLDTIRQIRPQVFIQGISNGSFNSSFFVDRFKQLLLYGSAMFDIWDATIPQDNKHRRLLENVSDRITVNVVACEGSQRFVCPDTYKLWHNRNSRVGFEQLPLDRVVFKRIMDRVREVYHKGFFIEDDKGWLLVGWKGRVMNAFSAWYPRQTR